MRTPDFSVYTTIPHALFPQVGSNKTHCLCHCYGLYKTALGDLDLGVLRAMVWGTTDSPNDQGLTLVTIQSTVLQLLWIHCKQHLRISTMPSHPHWRNQQRHLSRPATDWTSQPTGSLYFNDMLSHCYWCITTVCRIIGMNFVSSIQDCVIGISNCCFRPVLLQAGLRICMKLAPGSNTASLPGTLSIRHPPSPSAKVWWGIY